MEDKDKWGIKYKYPDRTCKKCIRYPCFSGQVEVCKCDYAKYGCKNYLGKDENNKCSTEKL